MSLSRTIQFITNHPLNRKQPIRAVLGFVLWQLRSRIQPGYHTFRFGEKTRLSAKKGSTGATGNLYCGLHEFSDMGFLLHFLRKDDQFIDVGANIGSYTLLASSEIGATSTAFEPVPDTFQILAQNVALNPIEQNTQLHNMGVGSKADHLYFSSGSDSTVNHVVSKKHPGAVEVSVDSLDHLVKISAPCMIKIDVEGFEMEVINGMVECLNNPLLKVICIELNGLGSRYDYDETLIHQQLLKCGFLPYEYLPFERKLKQLETYGNHNTLYIRDLDFVEERVSTARKLTIHRNTF